ncbi:MAG: hypothetical protein VKJ24_04900 [Synechococcales bacterium]|nr:hypothetical protein [Synechococcales bacterium]
MQTLFHPTKNGCKFLILFLTIGLVQACSTLSPSVSQPSPSPVPTAIGTPAATATANPDPATEVSRNPIKDDRTMTANLPTYCSQESYKEFFQVFVQGRDRQGNETRATYTADRIEVRDYNAPDQVIGTLRRQDDEFSIDLMDYTWVQKVPSTVDNLPYTRLKLDIQRLAEDQFRVEYIQAQYKYTGDVTGTESEELVQTYGNPGAYIFQHRDGCWQLTQKLQVVEPNP